jgi:trehalose/maltose transport system substrate-binding protein
MHDSAVRVQYRRLLMAVHHNRDRRFPLRTGLLCVTSCMLLALIWLSGCTHRVEKPAPITLVLVDQGWFSKEFQDWSKWELQNFQRETGIHVELFPSPETTVDQIVLWKKLLESRSSTPDVYAIDVIWPKTLERHLIDLKPYLSQKDTTKYFPFLIKNDTVNGKLVALPSRLSSGLLFYRTDLLKRYGYSKPPETWEELQTMSAKIQRGERSRGDKNFWGYLWEGAPTEALTYNALEWQVSEGGGKIIEDNRVISVNNPQAIRSWQRAAQWVGTISPPGVIAYKAWDAMNIWKSGEAAFMRNWTTAYLGSKSTESEVQGNFDVTILPRGREGHTATLGGLGYGISRYSKHPKEAAALVLYLGREDTQIKQSQMTGEPPAIPSLYANPQLLAAFPFWRIFTPEYVNDLTARPATVTGENYADVSRAYFEAVHSVLTGKQKAAIAAAELEDKLMKMTGFPKGEPQPRMPLKP